jgi:DNA-binding CsgD family transcriptional regulator
VGAAYPKLKTVFAVYENGSVNPDVSATNLDPDYMKEYANHYINTNPMVEIVSRLNPGALFDAEQFFTRNMFRQTEFYNDWLQPQGRLDGNVGTVLTATDDEFSVFCTHFNSQGSPAFSSAEAAWLLRTLAPHFQRALEVRRRMTGAAVYADMLEQALDQIGEGVFVVNRRGVIRFANHRAERYLKHQYAVRSDASGTLRVGTASQSDALHRLIWDVSRDADPAPVSRQPASIRFSATAELECVAFVCPLRIHTSSLARLQPSLERQVMVLVSEVGLGCSPPAPLIGAVFGLTPAEARLSRALMTGKTLNEYAEQLNLSRNTVRNQLQSLFSKTGTSRQTELALILRKTFSDAVYG